MTHSKMLATRRKKQKAKKRIARLRKQAKNLGLKSKPALV